MKQIFIFLTILLLSACTYTSYEVNVPLDECKYEKHFATAHQGGTKTYVKYNCDIYVSVNNKDFSDQYKTKTNLINENLVY